MIRPTLMPRLGHDRAVLILAVLATLALAWLALELAKPILWAVVGAIAFKPLERRLVRLMPRRRNLAAILALLAMIGAVALPAGLLANAILNEAGAYYAQGTAQQDIAQRVHALQNGLPRWVEALVARSGLTDLEAWAAWLRSSFIGGARSVAAGLLSVGQSIFAILIFWGVLLYLAFFLLRDSDAILAVIQRASPLDTSIHRTLVKRFVAVIRVTLKGTFVVALVQGALGGLLFWAAGLNGPLLWGAAMATASLIPSVGTGLIWVPVGSYLLIVGHVWQGAAVLLSGGLVIGLVDNLLRPALIGKDARIPDYIVLVAILGGLQLYGVSGLVLGPVAAALFVTSWTLLLGGDADPPGQSAQMADGGLPDPER